MEGSCPEDGLAAFGDDGDDLMLVLDGGRRVEGSRFEPELPKVRRNGKVGTGADAGNVAARPLTLGSRRSRGDGVALGAQGSGPQPEARIFVLCRWALGVEQEGEEFLASAHGPHSWDS